MKRKLKFGVYKHCVEATQLKNKTKHREKSKHNVNSLREDHEEFIKTMN